MPDYYLGHDGVGNRRISNKECRMSKYGAAYRRSPPLRAIAEPYSPAGKRACETPGAGSYSYCHIFMVGCGWPIWSSHAGLSANEFRVPSYSGSYALRGNRSLDAPASLLIPGRRISQIHGFCLPGKLGENSGGMRPAFPRKAWEREIVIPEVC